MNRPADSEPTTGQEGHRPRILVVDDDHSLRTAVSRQLLHVGYDILEASDGREAMALLRDVAVDLTILDIFMPNVDGIELTVRLREEVPGAKIIALSGGGVVDAEDALEIARRVGAARTLVKPFTVEELLAAVGELLGDVA